ncbi:MAG: tetratricopeptide repeat protein [Candidatus Odinarchaeota archaeon]
MSYPELKALTRAEQFFDAGKLDKALEILNDQNHFKGLNLQQKSYFQFLKGLILAYQNKHEEDFKLGKEIFKEGQKLDNNLLMFDGYYFIIIGLGLAYKFEEAFKIIEKAEALLGSISIISKQEFNHREVRLGILRAWMNLYCNKVELAETNLKLILHSENETLYTFEYVWANLLMAQTMFRAKSKFDLGMKYTNKALSLAKEIKFNHFWIANCHLHLGVIYGYIGETDMCLKHSMKSLELFREINNIWFTANLLNNVATTYVNLGEYDLSLKFFEESLLVWEQDPVQIESVLCSVIEVVLEMGDFERVQKYFHRLENLYNKKQETSSAEMFYQFAKAIILKKSSRIRDRAKSEELLKSLIKKENLFFDLSIYEYIHLCDLLLSEFQLNNNIEVLDEVNHYIDKLRTIAEKSHSYIVFCETFILQAKLALINFNIKAARRFLTQAQKIAESYSMKRLAMKISLEHDELLNQLTLWEKLKESGASLSERWKLADLNKQMENMVKKRKIDVLELPDEEPVLLLIVSEGGVPFFSQSFMEDKSFEDHLFGGFFTTINSFINEIFSEGLDRASFGKYTLLMNSIPPFLMCYIYKGQSYSAQKRIKSFINELKSKKELWDVFEKFYQMNKKIHMEDIPSLEFLINKNFRQIAIH